MLSLFMREINGNRFLCPFRQNWLPVRHTVILEYCTNTFGVNVLSLSDLYLNGLPSLELRIFVNVMDWKFGVA